VPQPPARAGRAAPEPARYGPQRRAARAGAGRDQLTSRSGAPPRPPAACMSARRNREGILAPPRRGPPRAFAACLQSVLPERQGRTGPEKKRGQIVASTAGGRVARCPLPTQAAPPPRALLAPALHKGSGARGGPAERHP